MGDEVACSSRIEMCRAVPREEMWGFLVPLLVVYLSCSFRASRGAIARAQRIDGTTTAVFCCCCCRGCCCRGCCCSCRLLLLWSPSLAANAVCSQDRRSMSWRTLRRRGSLCPNVHVSIVLVVSTISLGGDFRLSRIQPGTIPSMLPGIIIHVRTYKDNNIFI